MMVEMIIWVVLNSKFQGFREIMIWRLTWIEKKNGVYI
jgi:hypothetical protein